MNCGMVRRKERRGALEIFLVMRENMFNIELISVFSFLRSISAISVIKKSNKANGQNQLLGQCRSFYEKTGGLFMYSVSRPSKDGLMLLTWLSDLCFED